MNGENLFEHKKSTLILQVSIGILFAFVSFIFFAVLASTVFKNEKLTFDLVVTDYIYSFRNPVNTKIMILLSDLGFWGIIFITFLVSGFLAFKKRLNLSMYFLFIVSSGFIVNILLKLLVQRTRPDNLPLAIEKDFSFPSGHTMISFIFFVAIVYLYYHLTKKKGYSTILLLIFLVITFFIGVSRIYLGVHFPSDILGGFIAGFLWFVGVMTSKKGFTLFKIIKK